MVNAMHRTARLAVLVALTVVWPVGPALARAGDAAAEFVLALMPITPEQAREVSALLGAPDTLAGDLVEAGQVVVATAPSLPAALVHDVLTAPVRHAAVLGGLVADTLDLAAPRRGEPRGLFRHTLRALHRSRLFTAAAGAVRRVTRPENRTARLAIVLATRAHGLPIEAGDLDRLRQAIDREAPDLGPLLLGVLQRLSHAHGRDAVRLLLIGG